MNSYKYYVSTVIVTCLLFLQGCAGTPVSMGVSKDFVRSVYDMESPRQVSKSTSGFQLLLVIPISINDRHERAYAAIEAEADGGLISDVQVKESWTYALIGTVYTTTIEANIYPRKRTRLQQGSEGEVEVEGEVEG